MNIAGDLDLTDDLSIDESFFGAEQNGNDGFPPRKKVSNQSIVCLSRYVSMEPLKSKSIPLALCDLISNMIDCINGNLARDESYSHISDVCDDLKRMLDKPKTYLHDLNLTELSVTGLQLDKVDFGRGGDFSKLKGAYERSKAGKNEYGVYRRRQDEHSS